jgi:hypothetical protein
MHIRHMITGVPSALAAVMLASLARAQATGSNADHAGTESRTAQVADGGTVLPAPVPELSAPIPLPELHNGLPDPVLYVVFAVLVVYAIMVLSLRYLWVVKPSREEIAASKEVLCFEAKMLGSDEHGARISEATTTFFAESELFKTLIEKRWWQRLLAFAGDHAAARKMLHAVERSLLLHDNYARVHARGLAITALGKLQKIQDPPTDLKIELKAKIAEPDTSFEELRPLVQEARAFVAAYQDEQFMITSDAKNKGLFLLMFAMLALLPIVYFYPQTAVLFVAGGIGGMLARLRTAVSQNGPAFDFGLSWSVMFLTPIVGALTAWFGVLLVMATNQIGITGGTLQIVSLATPNAPQTMLVAFIFGWSATLFDHFISKVERNIQGVNNDEKPDLENAAVRNRKEVENLKAIIEGQKPHTGTETASGATEPIQRATAPAVARTAPEAATQPPKPTKPTKPKTASEPAE